MVVPGGLVALPTVTWMLIAPILEIPAGITILTCITPAIVSG